MAVPNIKRSRSTLSLGYSSTPPAEPPSPTLSAVHASGASTPVPKSKLVGSSATTPTSSIILKRSIAADAAERKAAKSDSTPHLEERQDLTQSRWFPRPWPRKSVAVTKVAPETIERESPPPTPPEPETTTLAPVSLPEQCENREPSTTASSATLAVPAVQTTGSTSTLQPSVPIEESTNEPEANKGVPTSDAAPAAPGWLGWWWSAPPPQQPATAVVELPAKEPEPEEPTLSSHAEEHPPVESVKVQTNSEVPASEPESTATDSHPSPPPPVPAPARGSWIPFWGGRPAIQPAMNEPSKPSVQGDQPSTEPVPSITVAAPATALPPASEPAPPPLEQTKTPVTGSKSAEVPGKAKNDENTKPATPASSSVWGFWYRGGGNATAITTELPKATEIPDVVISVPQAKPQAEAGDSTPPVMASSSKNTSSIKTTTATATMSTLKKEVVTKDKDKNGTATPPQPKTPPPTPASSSPATNKLQRICPPNHVFPGFDSCYASLEPPSLLCKLTQFFKPPPPISKKHLYLSKTPRKIKKAVAIGVHGFFPMRLVRTVLGEPTGTSVRFAESAAAAIKRWAERNNVEVEIEKVALEGEGKVADRVDTLWKLLENWMDHVRNADFVMIAAHSQGVVVGLQLLARMIEQGCVDNARVGVAAMAGINLGPFYHLPTSILTGSAKELFEFQRPDSHVSKRYIQALRVVLAHDTRIVFVGSIDDQLVPLESSTFANIHHPYIYRAVFVDGRVHAPDFLSHLVGFAMKIRNLGVSDHGLIRELSSPLAGSLYGGEGHSRIYDDGAVYDIAVRHALETTDCPDVPLKVDSFVLPTSTNTNPFFLPWSMRGLLEESFVRERLADEKHELLKHFEDWKPTSKVLKDVKFRLEGIRSKL